MLESVLVWAREVGKGLNALTDEQRREILLMVVEQVVIDRDNNVDITLAIPIDDPLGTDAPEPESPTDDSVAIASAIPSFPRKRESIFCLITAILNFRGVIPCASKDVARLTS